MKDFICYLTDGSTREDFSWAGNATEKVVDYFGSKKHVYVSTLPIAKLIVFHGGLQDELDVPDGCEVYLANRSQTTFIPDQPHKDQLVGRVIGLVKDNQVIEEKFLNGVENQVFGMKL